MKICLNMIVRNEASIIEKCLVSVMPDYYVIGDTGSTDGTQEIIKNFFDQHNIQGEIHQFPFIDFAQARNEALRLAYDSKGDFDYILLTDADMELKVNSITQNWKNSLLPVCLVRQTNSSISYNNVRILHRKVDAKYIGKTHEYLSTAVPGHPIQSIWFDDHANGSSRSEKTKRDLRLLHQSLKENPKDGRSMFYIAQTYKDLGEWSKALKYYKERVVTGGWTEEVWYSIYMQAYCYKQLGKDTEFIAKSLDAFQFHPSRAESLCSLAAHFRESGKNELAFMTSERGKDVPYPVNDSLFIEDSVYKHGFDSEIAINGFYVKDASRKQRGYDTCMHLTTCRMITDAERRLALSNSRFYAKPAVSLFPSFKYKKIEIPTSNDFTVMNSSVSIEPNGATNCIVRSVNYKLIDDQYISPNNIVETENYFCTVNDDLTIGASNLIKNAELEPKTGFSVRGYEDCRLLWWKNEWWATATIRDRHPTSQCEIVLFNLERTKEHVLRQTGVWKVNTQNEKNWMPIVPSDTADLFILYTLDPTVVLRVIEDEDGYEMNLVSADESCPFNLSTLRGSSQCVLISKPDAPKRYLVIAHESFRASLPWQYLHRFVELNDKFKITRISNLFHFVKPTVEFCAGMAIQGSKALINFSVEESQGFIAEIDLSDIESQLQEPIRHP